MTLHQIPAIPIPRLKKENDKKDNLPRVTTEARRNLKKRIEIMIVRKKTTETRTKKISIKLKKSKNKKVVNVAEAMIKRRNTIDHVREITYFISLLCLKNYVDTHI
jgi:hypothetical protein